MIVTTITNNIHLHEGQSHLLGECEEAEGDNSVALNLYLQTITLIMRIKGKQ